MGYLFAMYPKASDLLKNTHRAPEIFLCATETSQWRQIASAYLGFSTLSYPSLLRLRRGDCIRLQELTDVKTFWQIFLRRGRRRRPKFSRLNLFPQLSSACLKL